MSIVYYPNRVYKGQVPSIDRVLAKRKPEATSGTQDISTAPIDFVLHSDDNWMVDSISFMFSNNTVARDFSAYIANGREVVENLNDYLWFYVVGVVRQKITLDPGFYTGTQLAAQLQTQLNTAYAGFGITFTVVYTAATGLFVITPSASTISYLNTNTHQDFRNRDSIAGHLFGLTATSNLGVNVTSDTPVFGLDDEVAIINQTSSTVDSYYHNTLHVLTMDQAIRLASNVGAAVTASYNVIYESVV